MSVQDKPRIVAFVEVDGSALQGMVKEAGLPVLFSSAEDFLNSNQQRHIAYLIANIRFVSHVRFRASDKP